MVNGVKCFLRVKELRLTVKQLELVQRNSLCDNDSDVYLELGHRLTCHKPLRYFSLLNNEVFL